MVIAILKLDLHIPASGSLKHKRMILNSFKGRLRGKFNVSIAEIGSYDKWQRAIIAICQVGQEKTYIDRTMNRVLKFAESFKGLDILRNETEIL